MHDYPRHHEREPGYDHLGHHVHFDLNGNKKGLTIALIIKRLVPYEKRRRKKQH